MGMKVDQAEEIRRLLAESHSKHLKAYRLAVARKFLTTGSIGFIPTPSVQEVIEEAGTGALRLLSQNVAAVLRISPEPGAYGLLLETVTAHLSDLEYVVNTALRAGTFAKQSSEVSKFIHIRADVFRILEAHRGSFAGVKNAGGRPPEWDWKDAEAFVLSQLSQQGSTVPIRQARVAEMLAERFMDLKGDQPSESLLQKHARNILK